MAAPRRPNGIAGKGLKTKTNRDRSRAESNMPVQRIVSGGQSGVDRAALDVALRLDLPCGGWCPAGRRAEDGPLPRKYPLEETPSKEYPQRTRWNVRDSDATLLLHAGTLGTGSEFTARLAREMDRSLLEINLARRAPAAAAKVREWIERNGIAVLNVAGPRESTAPGIYALAVDFLKTVFTSPQAVPAPPRKGARRMSEIPPDVLKGLNSGELETRTLPEGLAIDFRKLLRASLPAERTLPEGAELEARVGITRRMAFVGGWLQREFGMKHWDHFAGHRSDTVRGWGAYMLGAAELPLARRLHLVQRLADDSHSGVREWAWLALRPAVAAELDTALSKLVPWTKHKSANVRRFASEMTRPRGVWCSHLEELKQTPEMGRPILDPLRGDPSKYVQDSVANWLNDASKSRPEWVEAVCDEWLSESDSEATRRICHRALRTLRRQGLRPGPESL